MSSQSFTTPRDVHRQRGRLADEEEDSNIEPERCGAVQQQDVPLHSPLMSVEKLRCLTEDERNGEEEEAGRRNVEQGLDRIHLLALEKYLDELEADGLAHHRRNLHDVTGEMEVHFVEGGDEYSNRHHRENGEIRCGNGLIFHDHADAEDEDGHERLHHLQEAHAQVEVCAVPEPEHDCVERAHGHNRPRV